jgi:hypothetical protein
MNGTISLVHTNFLFKGTVLGYPGLRMTTPMSSPGSAVKGSYFGTPQHMKTLDLLGRSKNFQKLSKDDVLLYFEIAKTKHNCNTFDEVCESFEKEYEWDVSARKSDLLQMWIGKYRKKSSGSSKKLKRAAESSTDEDSESSNYDDMGNFDSENDAPLISNKSGKWKTANKSSESTNNNSKAKSPVKTTRKEVDEIAPTNNSAPEATVTVVFKAGSNDRPVLLCQVNDDLLQFTGDSGAVGRLFCDQSHGLRLDLKGRQYSGQLTAGPTMMILNLAPPVGQSSANSNSNNTTHITARAEVVTNEFCHLTFERDLHGSLPGLYTGAAGADANAGFQDSGNEDSDRERTGSTAVHKKSGTKSKKIGRTSEKDEENTTGGSAIINPKISTITQRKRKSSSGKGSGKSKKSKS